MRRTTTAILLAVGLALTGCGNNHDDAKTAAKPHASPTVDKETAYLDAAHEITFNGSPSDAELLAYPESWCAALDEGHSVAWLLGEGDLYPIGDEWGTVKQDAYELVVAGVKAYCPGNLDAVKAELRASGEY
ncbi:DUF732 domain-containing protein [Streptomyces sp. NPDC006332]|uniref:DUF732 domain-containing protein n=1 Tax=Streptomyces sp. NPDC006332 TaxID=3155456 RepID=UPI0033A74F43